jgi:hypothetical protein
MPGFGLLMFHNGKWGDNTTIINENYCKAATTTSQDIKQIEWRTKRNVITDNFLVTVGG